MKNNGKIKPLHLNLAAVVLLNMLKHWLFIYSSLHIERGWPPVKKIKWVRISFNCDGFSQQTSWFNASRVFFFFSFHWTHSSCSCTAELHQSIWSGPVGMMGKSLCRSPSTFPQEFKMTCLGSCSSLCFFCCTLFSSLVPSNYLCGATGLLR